MTIIILINNNNWNEAKTADGQRQHNSKNKYPEYVALVLNACNMTSAIEHVLNI